MKATAVGGPVSWRMAGQSPVLGATRWESSSECVAFAAVEGGRWHVSVSPPSRAHRRRHHPATRCPVTDRGTCGDCAHLILKDGPALGVGAGRWWKCTQALKDGRGPDIVRSWPSCTAWRQREEET